MDEPVVGWGGGYGMRCGGQEMQRRPLRERKGFAVP